MPATKKKTTTKKSTASAKKPTPKKTTKASSKPKAAKKKVVSKSPTEKRAHKKTVMEAHRVHGKDTGSPQVQVAILTHRIDQLSDHLKTHPKDKHSRRGLIGMVGDRRKLLRYLQMNDPSSYAKITKDLGIRK